jgi:ribose transport system ATP-binding protein
MITAAIGGAASAEEVIATEPLLRATAVRKVFGGTVALADASLHLQAGEIHGLLGENGAGKSTLIRILAGAHKPDGGTVEVAGEDITSALSPQAVRAAGISFIHQSLDLVGDLSVAENIAMEVGYPRKRSGLIDWRAVQRQAADALAAMGVEIDPHRQVASLPIAAQATVAIARALALDCRVLILDEPTASLAAGEVDALFAVLNRLRETGIGILFVSHRMDEVFTLCDQVTVLRNGSTVAQCRIADSSEEEIVELIVGHAVEPRGRGAAAAAAGPPVLKVRDLEGSAVGPMSFELSGGEILGFTGLSDGGQQELGELLFGLSPPHGGSMELGGSAYAPSGPREAIRRRVAYVPADRAQDGVAAHMSLRENLFANPADGGVISLRREKRSSQELLDRFGVRPAEPERELATLSGGNAQKTLLAKWLARKPDLIILNEPTTGVDIGAREHIHEVVRAAAAEGAAVLVISSDFDELAALCHRTIVLWRGLPSACLEGSSLSTDNITKAAVQRAS